MMKPNLIRIMFSLMILIPTQTLAQIMFLAPEFYETGNGPRSACMKDLDGNSTLDLVVANQASNNFSVLLNNGDGTFGCATNYNTGNVPHMACISDFDSDGDNDLAVVNRDSDDIHVYMNSRWYGQTAGNRKCLRGGRLKPE